MKYLIGLFSKKIMKEESVIVKKIKKEKDKDKIKQLLKDLEKMRDDRKVN